MLEVGFGETEVRKAAQGMWSARCSPLFRGVLLVVCPICISYSCQWWDYGGVVPQNAASHLLPTVVLTTWPDWRNRPVATCVLHTTRDFSLTTWCHEHICDFAPPSVFTDRRNRRNSRSRCSAEKRYARYVCYGHGNSEGRNTAVAIYLVLWTATTTSTTINTTACYYLYYCLLLRVLLSVTTCTINTLPAL